MSHPKQGSDLYRPIIKEGTHLAPSKKTPGAFRGAQLSDANNQIDGQTEWVKVKEDDYDYGYPPYDYENEPEPAELTEEQREMAAMMGEAAAAAIIALAATAAPHIKNWWQEKVAPSIKKTWQGISGKKNAKGLSKKHTTCDTEILSVRSSVSGLFTQEIDEAYEKFVNNMTSEEAQRELLDIFILSAVVAAKIRKLSNARIVNYGNPQEYIEGKEVIEKLSAPKFVDSINRILQINPNLLEEKSPALSMIVGRSLIVDGEYLPIENKALRETFSL